MNGKQAKRLRRGAAAYTVGQLERAYMQRKREIRDEHGGTAIVNSDVRLQPNTIRGLYQRAKRAFRRYGP